MQRNRHLASKRGKFPQYVFAMGGFYGCELINWAGRSDQGQPREASRASHSTWRSEKSIELSDWGTNALVVARGVAGIYRHGLKFFEKLSPWQLGPRGDGHRMRVLVRCRGCPTVPKSFTNRLFLTSKRHLRDSRFGLNTAISFGFRQPHCFAQCFSHLITRQ